MAVSREILLRTGLFDTGTLSLIVIIFALISPLIVEFIIAKTGWGCFLFNRPKWAHLPQRDVQQRANAIPAE